MVGPYEREHALALAEEIVADEELMAVVEPLLPLVEVDRIREEIAVARALAEEEDDDSKDTDLEYDEDDEDDEDPTTRSRTRTRTKMSATPRSARRARRRSVPAWPGSPLG